jgi:hypothetical protein
MSNYDPIQLAFLDETLKDEGTPDRQFGRARKGTRAQKRGPFVRRRCVTIEALINLDGMVLGTVVEGVMDIVYMTHILLIHFITTRTFDIESLYHSTYFLTYPLQTVFYLLKTQKLLSYLLCSIYYIFATLE